MTTLPEIKGPADRTMQPPGFMQPQKVKSLISIKGCKYHSLPV